MKLHPVAEYAVDEDFLFSFEMVFATYSPASQHASVKIYTYPLTLLAQYQFYSTPSPDDISVEADAETGRLLIRSDRTKQAFEYVIDKPPQKQPSPVPETHISVHNSSTDKMKKKAAVYVEEQLLFSTEEVDAFYHDVSAMALYTLTRESVSVKEYSLFSIVKLCPDDVAFLFSKRVEVHSCESVQSAPVDYSLDTLLSIRKEGQRIDLLASRGDYIVYGTDTKRYQAGFQPDKICNAKNHIYVHSEKTKELLVLNKSLELEYTMRVESVYFTDRFILMYKSGKTVANHIDTFKYAFFVNEMVLNSSLVSVDVFSTFLMAVEQRSVGREGSPLFSISVSEYDIAERAKRTRAPVFDRSLALYGAKVYRMQETLPDRAHITTGIKDVSTAHSDKGTVSLAVSRGSFFVLTKEEMLELPISSLTHPFGWNKKKRCEGVAVRASAHTGELLLVGEELEWVCVFPSLILLCVEKSFSAELLFSVYQETPSFRTSLGKALFFLLDTDDIERCIDLLELTRALCRDAHEDVLSTMIRLLDEKNTKKLFSIIGRQETKIFQKAEHLARVVALDIELLEDFLDASTAQKKEHLVLDFVEFIAKFPLPSVRQRVLSALLARNMLYASARLMLSLETPFDSSAPFVQSYAEVNRLLQSLQTSASVPEEIEQAIEHSASPLFIGMLCERLSMLESNIR